MGLSRTVSKKNGDFIQKSQNWQCACALPCDWYVVGVK